ncbi:hypothetical protein AcW1_005883 [Taiwanofungus camphoratus]|nr:hypothetical protein AcW1_005883 [Antrodia cinnamomea]
MSTKAARNAVNEVYNLCLCNATWIHQCLTGFDLSRWLWTLLLTLPGLENTFSSQCTSMNIHTTRLCSTQFQMDTLASLVRFYRNKCAQQRALLERLKGEHTENKTLKKTVDELRSENDQLRQYLEYGQSVPSETSNLNGKRQMLDIHRHASGARTNSSPSSIVAPIGPDRLTLRPDHQAPNFAPRHAQQRDEFMQPQVLQGQNASGYPQARDRPGSSRFAQHYAYAPPQTPRTQTMSMPTLTHAQSAPTRQALTRQPHVPATGPGQAHTAMMPPPAVTRDSQAQFQQKPKRDASGSVQQDQSEQSSHNANSRIQMPPPQTPLLQRTAIQQRSSIRPPPTPQLQASESAQRFIPQTPTRAGPNPSSGRFLPQQPQRRFQLPSMQSAGPQRFIGSVSGPGVISAGNPDSSSSSRAPSRAASISISGGQRVPFVPGS